MFTAPIVLPEWATPQNNGKLNDCHLKLVEGGQKMERNAATSWRYLVNECAKAGVILTYTGLYRSLQQQQSLYLQRGGRGVATPGKSMHGWGLAVDMSVNGFGAAAESVTPNACAVVAWIITVHGLPWAWEGQIGKPSFEPWHLNCVG